MASIYYLEDIEKHFDALTTLLRSKGFTTYPEKNNWPSELNEFTKFIQEQASSEKKKKLEEIILKYNPDLLIIDISLGVDEAGDGEDVYRNFIMKSKDLRLLPVIYLTIVGKRVITLYSSTKHVLKILKKFGELDVEAMEDELLKNISELLKPASEKSIWGKIIDSI